MSPEVLKLRAFRQTRAIFLLTAQKKKRIKLSVLATQIATTHRRRLRLHCHPSRYHPLHLRPAVVRRLARCVRWGHVKQPQAWSPRQSSFVTLRLLLRDDPPGSVATPAGRLGAKALRARRCASSASATSSWVICSPRSMSPSISSIPA
jgi:hypothetical protein